MRRRHLLALAILALVVATVVITGPVRVWRTVAYVKERQRPVNPLYRWFFDPPGVVTATAEVEYVLVMRKRFHWIPGPDPMVRCAWCVESDHPKCPGQIFVVLPDLQGRPPGFWETYSCTCLLHSHAQESE